MGSRQSILDRTSLVRGGGSGTPGRNQVRPLTGRGRVMVAPAAETDPMVVSMIGEGLDYGYTIPAGNWQPQGTTLPSVGDVCLIVFDDQGDAWVPLWHA